MADTHPTAADDTMKESTTHRGCNAVSAPLAGGSEHGRLTPHQLWREQAIWLLDALTDATRELRESGELDAVLAHLDKPPSLFTGTEPSRISGGENAPGDGGTA